MVITPTIPFVELSSRGISQSERTECSPIADCVGDRRREREREKQRDMDKKWITQRKEREEKERKKEEDICIYTSQLPL